jgi:hypothetical protein
MEEEFEEEFEEEEDMKPSAIFISGRSIIGLPSIDSKETSRCTGGIGAESHAILSSTLSAYTVNSRVESGAHRTVRRGAGLDRALTAIATMECASTETLACHRQPPAPQEPRVNIKLGV